MIIPATAKFREVHNEDTLVLRDSLHHPERVPPDELSVHHVAPVMSSTQTSLAPTSSSRSHSSYTTPLPWTTPPPTAFTVAPGPHSSPPEHPGETKQVEFLLTDNLDPTVGFDTSTSMMAEKNDDMSLSAFDLP